MVLPTLAEFTLQRTDADFYDISMINGVNAAVKMVPQAQPTQTSDGRTGDDYWCKAPGAQKSTVASQNCSWDLAPYVASVPVTPGQPGTDYTSLLLDSASQCSTDSRISLPGCPAGYTCSGAPGICFQSCTADSQCGAGLQCLPGANQTSYCQCQSQAACSSNPVNKYCGSAFVPGLGIYLQQCGPFAGWWSADDFCANSSNVFGPFNCASPITDGDSNSTNLASLFGCNGAGGGNPANEGSCYIDNTSGSGCCGCATSTQNPLYTDWPKDAAGECSNNNPAWAAQIQPWLVNLKKSCPTAYSYPFDDATSTFQCQGQGSINLLGYKITFDNLVVPAPKRLARLLKQLGTPSSDQSNRQ